MNVNEHDSISPWARMRVGPKISLISLFFLVAIAAIIAFTINVVSDQDTEAFVIELIGRQRMLQKQHLAQTILVLQKDIDAADLAYTRKAWESSQEALITGGTVISRLGRPDLETVPPSPTEALRARMGEQLDLIRQAIQISEALISAPVDTEAYRSRLSDLLANDARLQALGIENARAFTARSLEKVQWLIRAEVIIGVVVAILGLWFGWVVARGIVRPLQRVVGVAESVARGDLRIEKLQLSRQDEVGQLARAFDNMLENLKELSSQIVSVTGNVSSAAAEILASTQQQASSTKEQAATVVEVTTTMQEITQSGVEITERAKQVAASAEATSSASNSGIAAVQNTSRLMESTRQQVEEVAVKIVALSEKTQAIGEIVNTVNEISEQSNLLALNASIEAASAGEQGSRFAVVATEMRNLAERAKESTVQVGSILSEIQKGINSSVMLAEEAVKRSESGKHQAEVTEQTIHQMMRTTVDSINAFQQIIGATNQQQIGFDQVSQGMRDIRQATEQTAVGTSQLEKAIANLNELSLQLRAAVGRYQV